MAKTDVIKFRELLLTDPDFQEKLSKAAEAYTGDNDGKAVFDNVLVPLAGEYGLSATYEEFKDYMDEITEPAQAELSEDELAQVAGGKVNGGGVGGLGCEGFGGGLGVAGGEYGGGLCLIFGYGFGGTLCLGPGASVQRTLK